MLYICEKKGGLFGVKDTDDNSVEYVNRRQLYQIIDKYHLQIKGVTKEGIKVVQLKQSNYQDVIDDFFRLMKRESGYTDKQSDVEDGHAAVRDWGSWHVPDDAYDDFDEDEIEDYDWEELDGKWYPVLRKIKEELTSRYPDLKIDICTSEKNWVDMSILGRRS